MDKQLILSKLCYYDKRNPNGTKDDEEIDDHKKYLERKKDSCHCDNCFYGRTELAEELLRTLDLLNKIP